MVLGNGLMAQLFSSYSSRNDVCVIASGVSYSKISQPEQFERERQLLLHTVRQNSNPQNSDPLFVYFSTCSLYDPSEYDSPYCRHKLLMESIIREQCSKFLIFRISQAVGQSGNANTLLNFLLHSVYSERRFELWIQSWRNLIGVDEIRPLVEHCIAHEQFYNTIVNIANPFMISVKTLVDEIEHFIGKKAFYTPIAKGAYYTIDISQLEPIITSLVLPFGECYNTLLLERYYPSFAR